jgi:transcriptional regulator with GAF, ATPase, and Fis domain
VGSLGCVPGAYPAQARAAFQRLSRADHALHGRRAGAFTGAVATRQGVFEQADGGTLFLDEIGELPKDLQPKLVCVLEKRELKRVGSAKEMSVDVRVVAATNRNTLAEVKRGGFRQDFYRLAAAHVIVPPLRDRMEDLPLWSSTSSRKSGRRVR